MDDFESASLYPAASTTKNRLFNAGALVSLVLLLAIVGLAVSNVWFDHWVGWISPQAGPASRFRGISASNAALGFASRECRYQEQGWLLNSTTNPVAITGVSLSPVTFNQEPRFTEFLIADWLLGLSLVLVLAFWFRRWSRQRAVSLLVCCRQCGYDLRGSQDRCPECGHRPGDPRESKVLFLW